MDRIYIHDACVLLDLIEGDLLDLWFQLGFETRTTHLVYQEILEEEQFSLLQTYVDADKLILESIDESDLPALNAQAKEWKVSLQDVSVAHLVFCFPVIKGYGQNLLKPGSKSKGFYGFWI